MFIRSHAVVIPNVLPQQFDFQLMRMDFGLLAQTY
jgi:hypothetical protein